MAWVSRILAVLGLMLVGWALVTAGPAIVHGHPAYPMLLMLVVVGSLWALLLHRTQRDPVRGWRRVGSIALALGGAAGLAVVVFARPFTAQEPALTAMQSDSAVTVSESATRIVLMPTRAPSATGVFFQPGAKVESRAYAAVLRPLAEAGHLVVIVKQPLTIAFLALGAFDAAQEDFPEVEAWVLGGHSLGGTVAAIQADGNDEDAPGAARGLLLHASYPGSDISGTLRASAMSISGTLDGLATPTDIEASRDNLPRTAQFLAIEGAVHSFFGDYGPQPGDGVPTISHDEARTQISNASVEFVAQVAGAPVG
jgi:dienelactone hydrolase